MSRKSELFLILLISSMFLINIADSRLNLKIYWRPSCFLADNYILNIWKAQIYHPFDIEQINFSSIRLEDLYPPVRLELGRVKHSIVISFKGLDVIQALFGKCSNLDPGGIYIIELCVKFQYRKIMFYATGSIKLIIPPILPP